MMSARRLLEEMLDLIQAQVEAVVAGDAQAVLDGTARHEQLLSAIQTVGVTEPPEELSGLRTRIDQKKTLLRSLLWAESVRIDFLLRLILGAGETVPAGYPGQSPPTSRGSRILNRRA